MSNSALDSSLEKSRKPKNLHIAHRRSPSELTTLMVEQYNLQRQLEAVQQQQKALLQQQQPTSHLSQPLEPYRSHSRTSSSNQNKLPSSLANLHQTHARRHSLGLSEAKKAAATQKQSNMASLGGGPSQNELTPVSPQLAVPGDVGGYRFPNSPDMNARDTPSGSYGATSNAKAWTPGHQSFKFPVEAPNNLLPPAPTFGQVSPERNHQRRGSHYRSNSRNFDNSGSIVSNWRSQQLPIGGTSGHQRNQSNNNLSPPSAFVPGHKNRSSSLGGGNSSVSSMSNFMPQGNNNGNGRKSLFAPYLPQSSLPDLINEGRLVTGTLRVNKKNRSDAYVSTDGLLDADIFICGSKDRNRALEGDIVAVELLVVDEVWESKKEKEEKKRRKDNISTKSNVASVLSDDIHNDATSAMVPETEKSESESEGLGRRGSLKQRPTMKKNDDVEVEGQSLLLVEEEEINDDVKPLYAGHVVAVVDRIPGQIFAGTLGLLRPAQAAQAANDKRSGKESSVQTPKAPKIVWFKPTDKRVPLIAIPTEQAPRDFVENHENYADQLFIASIKRWPITSLHPFGTLVSRLGRIDDPAVEVDSILRDNNFLADEYPSENSRDDGYSSSFHDSLPNVEQEIKVNKRMEYISEYIISFTQNNQFVDHAMHVKRLNETKIELGFHCVDISFFVQPGSTLERKAKKRSLSVFLPQKVSHLYPLQLNKAISFKENEKNLAVSVVFEIYAANFEVALVSIHESVILPKSLVTYDAADSVLLNQPVDGISSATSDYIKTFALIAKEFRRKRLQDKSIGVSPSLSLLDQLDDEKVRLHMNIFEPSNALLVISEIGYKVNNKIASTIYNELGESTLLRRHALPTLQKLEAFVRKAGNLGADIDITSSVSLQKSILRLEDPLKRQCVETLLFKCMPTPKYFIAKHQEREQYEHFYLNMPLYTHFTAPLRRFADLVVHRQLKSVISNYPRDNLPDFESLKSITDYCNFKKDCGSNAQEQAIHLLLSRTINEMSENTGHLLVMGTVVQVYESSFDVIIPEFGIEKRVHGDQLPLIKAEFDKSKRILELYWENGVDSATYIPPDEKSSLSYRRSVKNKYRTSALEAAKIQKGTLSERNTIASESVLKKLASLDINAPLFSMLSRQVSGTTSDDVLRPYLKGCITRVEDNNYIQEVKELRQIPIVLRAEIGMSLPCLTVKALNPFA
ncbi:RNB-domain-containing protein [Metschnikowia bicuspidata var. bicuspidata NRRL YB-4993]|uniref:RNB-domain-containing protein n=1 Tax=Metschnikowia bicuspidata var. bicuspidata NRRL YB-4993 TaxID=869754 RepID=A0A1A0H5I6_9ASCO|nr:RNB-domain-containing protein [Metschnikowia bicuspidata var. bicuspidata NRRL YB-4993]OBA19354.1 RNB-domain-containing protein [Metschnikowia bicuspidata var. bicuspidata NRRL YB-4993]